MKKVFVVLAAIALLCIGGMAGAAVYEEHFDTAAGKWLVGDLGWINAPGYAGDIQVTNSTGLANPAIEGGTAPSGQETGVAKVFSRVPTASGYVLTANLYTTSHNTTFGFGADMPFPAVWAAYWSAVVSNGQSYLRFGGSGMDETRFDVAGYGGLVGLEISVDEANDLVRGKAYKSGMSPLDTGWVSYSGANVSSVVFHIDGRYLSDDDLDDIVVTAVPEPSSLLGLAGGLGVLLGLRRRR